MAVNRLLKAALLKPKSVFFYIAPTYKQAKMIAWTMLYEQVMKLPKELVVKVNESELYVVVGNGSRIDIKGAENPDSLRGVGLDGVVLDEYADMKPNVFVEIIRPALADKKGWAWFIGTPRGFNHFYDLYNEASARAGWSRHKFTSLDNPTIDPAEIEEIRKTQSEDVFAQEYLADFRKRTGLVYKEFQRENHVIAELPQRHWNDTICGVDFGYTNPAAMVIIKVDGDKNFYVVDEYYETGKTTPELAEKAKAFMKTWSVNLFYPDPAEPDRIEEFNRSGINCREVIKDVSTGVDKVRELFKSNRLKILPNCKNLIWELETYRYPKKQENKNEKEEPEKENDHAVDALRYALFTYLPVETATQEDFNLYGASYAS